MIVSLPSQYPTTIPPITSFLGCPWTLATRGATSVHSTCLTMTRASLSHGLGAHHSLCQPMGLVSACSLIFSRLVSVNCDHRNNNCTHLNLWVVCCHMYADVYTSIYLCVGFVYIYDTAFMTLCT